MPYVDYVNLMIGTAGNGHAIPGPQRPHGLVKLSPDTITLPCAGYDYNDGRVIGFSHTHLEGVGGRGGRGNLLLTATTGPLAVEETEYASRFSHRDESARVGYYQVRLQDYDVNAELAATEHCGFHRYTFPTGRAGRILLDVGHTLGGRNRCTGGEIRITGDRSFEGCGHYPLLGDASQTFIIYFSGEADAPFDTPGTWSGTDIFEDSREISGSKIGMYLGYEAGASRTVAVKIAISYVSVEKARSHLAREIPGWDFDKAVADTAAAWEELLGRVRVEGHTEDYRIQFYSALYRSLNQPTDYTEHDEYFDGVGGRNVYPSEGRHFYSDDWAIWDTFRTTHPLQNLIEPERAADQAQTLVRMYRHGGWLPMCTGPAVGYNQTMIGHNAASVLADAVAAGHEDFDLETAWDAMIKQATQFHPEQRLRMLGAHPEYLEKGYLPDDAVPGNTFSVSETLEYIYGDWCVAQMAKRLGREKDHAEFLERARNYRKLFDPETRFMRPRNRDGRFVEPFDPTDAFKRGFCETSSWEYTFFVPHDVQGLINLVGSDEAFAERLDEFFGKRYYNNQNETGIQTPFLYNYARKPWKTQEMVLRYVREHHGNRPAGLYGEDDAGAMSAWYVFASVGLYPVCPGQGALAICTPNFPHVTLRVGNRRFTIRCLSFALENIYIQGARLNGAALNRSWISYGELQAGGELELVMGAEPSDWATDFESAPPSLTTDTPMFSVDGISLFTAVAKPGEAFPVSLAVTNKGITGGGDIVVSADGIEAGKINVFLEAGESREVEVPCRLYALGRHSLTAQGKSAGVVSVDGTAFTRFACREAPGLSAVVTTGEAVTVTARVINTGSAPGWEAAGLCVNGDLAQTVPLYLKPGACADVEFRYTPPQEGNYALRVLDSPEAALDRAGTPGHDFMFCSGTPLAGFYQAGDNLYILAGGFQGKGDNAVLYHRHFYAGDFDAMVRIAYEENTNPYAGAGIIVKNDMGAGHNKGGMILGAMSVRGYFFNWNMEGSRPAAHPAYAVDCPRTPYWFKLSKRGKRFTGSRSEDGKSWIVINEVDYPEAAEKQHIGLFAHSGSERPRLVKFTDFCVDSVR